ncbi:energy transducer TonB [Henriciella litoralis]|uniref:energy transducer TonB n=1 Tax=Henriciella litoralis TaxID=568102 RepID=UPI000A01D010|nr:energy transducer TonB [Henriciella litoralis]
MRGLVAAFALAFTGLGASAQSLSLTRPGPIIFPADAEAAGLPGCCKMTFDVDADGKAHNTSGYCTSDMFEEAARHSMSRAKFSGGPASNVSMSVVFALEGETPPKCSSPDIWNDLTRAASDVFYWEAGDYETDEDYEIAKAKGLADLRTTFDFNGNCGAEPAYPLSSAVAVSRIGNSDALNRAAQALDRRGEWLDCRTAIYNGYSRQATETRDRYASLPATDFRAWIADRMEAHLSDEYGYLADRNAEYDSYLDAWDEAADNVAAAEARAAARRQRRAASAASPQARSEADRFFDSIGPGRYESCMQSANGYGARQACMNDWISRGTGFQFPGLRSKRFETSPPPVSTPDRPRPPPPRREPPKSTCPEGYSCSCMPPTPIVQGGGTCR